MADFPTSVPSITNPTANDTLAAVPHHTQHEHANDNLAAIGTKLGTGSSTPTSGTFLIGNGTGTSAWRSGIVVDARDFGVVGDTGADMAANIQAALDSLGTTGGEVWLPRGELRIYSGLRIKESDIRMYGQGKDSLHDVGATLPATYLNWFGDAGGKMLTIEPDEGASETKINGCEVMGVALFGRQVAGYGLYLRSHNGGRFNIYARECTSSTFYVGCVTTLGEATDAQGNEFWLSGRQLLTGDGNILVCDGGGGGNTSFNIFHSVGGQHKDQDAINLRNTDNNLFESVGAYRVSGSKYTLRIGAGPSDSACSRGNLFLNVTGAGGVIAEGTEVDTSPSVNNFISFLDKENGVPDPVIGTDARLYWTDNKNAGMYPPRHVTSFPSTKSANTRVLRTDEGLEYMWNGTYWLSSQLFTTPLADQSALDPTSTSGTGKWGVTPFSGGKRLYIPQIDFWYLVASTNDGSNYWTITVTAKKPDSTTETVATIDTSSASAGVNYADAETVAAAMSASGFARFEGSASKTGSPGALYWGATVQSRLIGA